LVAALPHWIVNNNLLILSFMSNRQNEAVKSPWAWIPSLYFAEGLPNVAIMAISAIMYKTLGISNREFAFYTAWLYLPWVIKPIWSPFVEAYKTKRFWIIFTQFFMGIGFALISFLLPATFFFKATLAVFWLLAFNSATHDIAADGFYIIGLSEHQQSWFVGIRSTFYRLAMMAGQGAIVMLAGSIENATGLESVNVDIRVVKELNVEHKYDVNSEDRVMKPLPGPMRVVSLTGNQVTLQSGAADPQAVDEFINKARELNSHVENSEVDNSFEKSWFDEQILSPVEETIKKITGRDANASVPSMHGNIAVSLYQLSTPPEEGQSVILNIGRVSGSKSVKLIAGGTKVFTHSNWNQPLMAVFQVDLKEKSNCSAVFRVRSGNAIFAWSVSFILLSVVFFSISLYHAFSLPTPPSDTARIDGGVWVSFVQTFSSFFRKKGVVKAIAFLLLYRLGESQLVKLAQPFMLDSQEVGGLAFSTSEVGFVYGTVGTVMLTVGGILGGVLAAQFGLRKVLFPMAIAMNLPNACYLYLAFAQPDSFAVVNLCVGFEQFGYGLGFTAFMLFMVSFAEDSGEHRTSHFAIMTGFMALGMMIPMMISGWIQEVLGYQYFFTWVLLATLPGFLILKFLPVSDNFGLKKSKR